MTTMTSVVAPPTAVANSIGMVAPGLLEPQIGAGWDIDDELDAMCHYAVAPPGKLFRPYLLLEACAAVGGNLHAAVPAALGAEYGHVASLVHDDIIDSDALRRGRASVPAEYGRDNAIVVGDTLIFRLFLALSECADRGASPDRVVASLRAVARAGVDLCRGQTADLRLRGDVNVGLDDYIEAVRGKTSAMFRGACEVGALLGGATEFQVTALATYGEQLGIAFQMADDLLAYRTTSGTAGKDLLSDLRNHQMTFPLIVAVSIRPAELRPQLAEVFACATASYRSDASDQEAFAKVRELLERTAAFEEAARIIQRYAADALAALAAVPPSESRDRLTAMVDAAVERVC